jgi:hypothetical protein
MDHNEWLEIVVDTYQKYFDGDVFRIVDAGSRDGDSAYWIASKLGVNEDCEVICIEARENAAQTIKEKYPNFLVFPTAISEFVGKTKFVSFNDDYLFKKKQCVNDGDADDYDNNNHNVNSNYDNDDGNIDIHDVVAVMMQDK